MYCGKGSLSSARGTRGGGACMCTTQEFRCVSRRLWPHTHTRVCAKSNSAPVKEFSSTPCDERWPASNSAPVKEFSAPAAPQGYEIKRGDPAAVAETPPCLTDVDDLRRLDLPSQHVGYECNVCNKPITCGHRFNGSAASRKPCRESITEAIGA